MFYTLNKINFLRNYRSEINKALAQNPSAFAKTILEISDTNSGLNFDENGDRRPDEYAAYCGIHIYDERQYIYRTRKLRVIPEDIQIFRYFDSDAPGGIRSEIFFHEFPEFWICAEIYELRKIHLQKWYLGGTYFAVTGLNNYRQLYIISTKKCRK